MGTGCPRAQAVCGSGRGLGVSTHRVDSPQDEPRWGRACKTGQERVLGPERLPIGTGVEAGCDGLLFLPKPLASTSPPSPCFSITVEKKARFQLWGPLAQPSRSRGGLSFPLTSQAARHAASSLVWRSEDLISRLSSVPDWLCVLEQVPWVLWSLGGPVCAKRAGS